MVELLQIAQFKVARSDIARSIVTYSLAILSVVVCSIDIQSLISHSIRSSPIRSQLVSNYHIHNYSTSVALTVDLQPISNSTIYAFNSYNHCFLSFIYSIILSSYFGHGVTYYRYMDVLRVSLIILHMILDQEKVHYFGLRSSLSVFVVFRGLSPHLFLGCSLFKSQVNECFYLLFIIYLFLRKSSKDC